MEFQCLTWIRYLWGQLVCSVSVHKKGFIRPLPDEIIVDILSRLPADCVLECRRVCRQWLALTSTPYFTEMHLKRASPVLLVQCNPYRIMIGNQLDMIILDEGAKKDKMIKKMRAGSIPLSGENNPLLLGSCNGLLLLTEPLAFCLRHFVCNPVTGEQITVSSPAHPGKLCGFFFHPLTKDYRLLYVHQKVCSKYCFQYFIYSLGGKMWRELGDFSYLPRSLVIPVVLNGALHWMVEHDYKNADDIPPCRNAIMIFNMDSENFCFMPHPGQDCFRLRDRHEVMHLLEMKGQLAFCLLFAKIFDIWVMEDYENWFWVKRYKVNLDWDVRRYPFDSSKYRPDYFNSRINLLSIQNGEVLMDWSSRGLFRYHLSQNTIRKIDRSGRKMPKMQPYDCRTTAYIMSFVSLSGFQ